METRNKLLSISDLEVKFRVRGRILTAIRGVSLDIYENESIAIVGESGSGKSVMTKTFAGMLDANGFISNGSIIFNDQDLADTSVSLTNTAKSLLRYTRAKLDRYSRLEKGAATWRAMKDLEEDKKSRESLTEDEEEDLTREIDDLVFQRTELYNARQAMDPSLEKERLRETGAELSRMDDEIKSLQARKKEAIRKHREELRNDSAYLEQYDRQMAELRDRYDGETAGEIGDAAAARNEILAKEIYLSVGRYGYFSRVRLINRLLRAFRRAMREGRDLMQDEVRNAVFDEVAFRVRYLDETPEKLHGTCVLNLAKIHYSKDWTQIRGGKIATVFQDPMTSLNPVITIGKQITSVILKHQNCSEAEARARALTLMKKVGIPNAENRYDDYPFQYSGGMRQRIVIAIALSCQPKILICDEPTTALDVTIQAQILKLLKDLQKEFGYTIVFITHDLGVVANIADRVAVLYAGQIVELGTVEEVFHDPRHPYTWALLSSLPQLAERNTTLYSISGTPPSLYNKIVGDPFAPRNPYCLKIDTLEEPPMFQVSETHFAKTWLLDPRAPKIEKPEVIHDIHGKLRSAFNI